MARIDVAPHLIPIKRLYSEIVEFIPQDTRSLQFRSDLSGLLVVAISAAYENCVKEVLVTYCRSHSSIFGTFAENQYEKLNSKITLKDLHGYAKLFGQPAATRFKEVLSSRRTALLERKGRDIVSTYEQVLKWRHQYAHAGQQNTTVEEAYLAHVYAKRVIYSFADALS